MHIIDDKEIKINIPHKKLSFNYINYKEINSIGSSSDRSTFINIKPL